MLSPKTIVLTKTSATIKIQYNENNKALDHNCNIACGC